MSFNYSFLKDIYADFLQVEPLFQVITGLKVVGGIFVIIVWYGRYLHALKNPKEYQMPISPKDIITGLGTIVLIGMYDELLAFLDYFWSGAENYYATIEIKPSVEREIEVIEKENADSWQQKIALIAHWVITSFRDPTFLIAKGGEGIAWGIDLMVYGLFLAERFFVLGILRILGGIALACSYHPKLTKWFWSWFAVYTAVYLLIIPYMMVQYFANQIYTKSEALVQSYGGGEFMGSYSPMIIVLIFVVWLKFKLFRASREIVYRIFN
jgi:hypothetical protein